MLLRRAMETRETVIDLNDPSLLDWLGIDPGLVNVRGKNALKEATVYACVRIRSEALGKLPLKVYREDDGIKKATGHYLYSLLKLRPNPFMSTSDFFRALEAQCCLYGNGYAFIEFERRGPDKGKVKGLYPIASDKVKVYVDDVGLLGSTNKVWYVVDLGAEKRRLTAAEMLHFRSGITLDGLVGIPPLDYLKYLLENGQSATRSINSFFKNGLQVKGLVQYVGDLNEDAKKKFREKFEEMSSGLGNAHRIALMPIGYQFQPISLTMADAQFLENAQLTVRQIAAAFGIKMHQLNDLERATHTNIEEQQRQFYADTLQAVLTMYEQEMTYKLFLDSELSNGYYCRFNIDSIIRADLKTRYEAHRIAIQGGFLTANEVRAMEELSPQEGGDQLLINGNMMPITKAGSQYLKGGEKDEGTAKA